jgi:hypothetical protein
MIGGRASVIGALTYRPEDPRGQGVRRQKSHGSCRDISCHANDLTTRNKFHNGKAQKKAKRWIDLDLSAGLTSRLVKRQ